MHTAPSPITSQHLRIDLRMKHTSTLVLWLALLFNLFLSTNVHGQSAQMCTLESAQTAAPERLREGTDPTMCLMIAGGKAHRWAHPSFQIRPGRGLNITETQHAPVPVRVSQEPLHSSASGGSTAERRPTSVQIARPFHPLSMEADPAHEQLRSLTDRLLKLNELDWVRFRDSFRPLHLVKGEHWLHAGDVCGHVGFVVSGLIHAYYIVQGEQVTQEFYFENTYATSYVSFLTGQPSQRYLQALDDTHLLILTREDLYRFYSGSQDAERMGRLIAEGAFMRFDNRTEQFLLKPPEQRYRDLLKDRPNVMQRVPQKLIASYLGIQPESLSRIRKRIAKG